MSSGHDGSFSTIHASSARDALYRLEALALMGASDTGPYVVRHMMGSGIDLLIHLGAYRRSDGLVRRLASLAFVDWEVVSHPRDNATRAESSGPLVIAGAGLPSVGRF